MRKLKDTIKSTADEIGLKIPNIDETRSRRNYNQYVMGYESSVPALINTVQNSVLLETSFAEISFPTVVLPVRSYIGDMMMEEAPEELSHYLLEPFDMKVQGLDRTLTDKVFAVCETAQNKFKGFIDNYNVEEQKNYSPCFNKYQSHSSCNIKRNFLKF